MNHPLSTTPIASVDPNFAVSSCNFSQALTLFPLRELRSLIYGVRQDPDLRRLPEDIARKVSDGVYQLHFHTAGGRIRFCTNSRHVAIIAQLNHISKMPHFAFSGSIGFDLYERIHAAQTFMGAAIPPLDISERLEYIWDLGSSENHELTMHLPIYSGVTDLWLGIDEGAVLTPAPAYTHEKPVVYYGSSITQGGCASRPGNAYPNQISMLLDCDHINLGFSGNAKAEDAMAQYISGLDMSVFVYDYDYNTPSVEYLAATHEKMFRTIRSAQPDLPIIMLSMPKYKPSDIEKQLQRSAIIRQTYLNAVAAGDKNAYFLPGTELLGDCAEFATVDNCHPTDLGFYMMARKLSPLIQRLL